MLMKDKEFLLLIETTLGAVNPPLAFLPCDFKRCIANKGWEELFKNTKNIIKIVKSISPFAAWPQFKASDGDEIEEKLEYETTVKLAKKQQLAVKFICRPLYWQEQLHGIMVSVEPKASRSLKEFSPQPLQILKQQYEVLGKQNDSLMAFVQPLTKIISTLLGQHVKGEDNAASHKHLNKLQLQDFIENVPVACAMFDRQMNYIMLSKAWHLLTVEKGDLNDYPRPEDMIGKNHYEVVPFLPRSLRESNLRCIREGISDKSEGDWYRDATGRLQWHRWECFPWYEDNDEIGGAIIFTEDITEKKNTEKLLERMKHTNALLEYFADMCSHDLKQPVRTIGNFTQILVQEFGHTLDEKAKGYLGEIQAGAKRLYGLIDSILAYTKIDIDENFLDQVSIAEIIDTVQADLAALIAEKKAQIKYKNLPTILSHKAILYHVFQNLISNSLKFCSFKIPVIKIESKRVGDYWHFQITDNGIGIPSEYNQNIFEMHWKYQQDRNLSGSGIGLAVCKRIVDALEGNIWVESSSPQGTSFAFTLPDKSRIS